ncbi:hypothetical protein PsorP6_016188 [Peronosclerospora sorghi]|uniref:Uncharacterized protein n=1 Tax=Peronosclerospora sorghi TaxID=230839 RepID=A0ACC0VS24_9STRA|nr:hypothetical protein PsorP6_016188 [Peronosclerospora sorghi]
MGHQHGIANEQEGGTLQEVDIHRGSSELHTDKTAKAELVEKIEQLKVALLRKHEEAKHIARQLEVCSEKLLSIRGESSPTIQSRQRHTMVSSRSNLHLTPAVLEAMDQKAGLPRRGLDTYTSSNVSSISGYSARSMPVPRSRNMHARSARATALANVNNMSVSSYASNLSNTSARRGQSPRGSALRNLTKRYNYMPQRYEATTINASEAGATSLSSRGAVISRVELRVTRLLPKATVLASDITTLR